MSRKIALALNGHPTSMAASNRGTASSQVAAVSSGSDGSLHPALQMLNNRTVLLVDHNGDTHTFKSLTAIHAHLLLMRESPLKKVSADFMDS